MGGAGEVPLGQPARGAAIERLAQQVGVRLDQLLPHLVLHVGLVLPADRFRGHDLAQADLGDGLVEVDAQPLVVDAGRALGLQQLGAHPVGQDHAGVELDRFQRGQQPGAVFGGSAGREPAHGGGRSELFGGDQPELDVAALELHRPVQPVGQAHAVGLVVVVGAGGEDPELALGQGFAAHRGGLGQQPQFAGREEDEAAAVADLDGVQGHGRAVAGVQALGDGVAVKHAEVHPLGGVVPADGFQRFLQPRGGVFVGAFGPARLHRPLAGGQGELALLEHAADLPVAQHFAVDVVLAAAQLFQHGVLRRERHRFGQPAARDVTTVQSGGDFAELGLGRLGVGEGGRPAGRPYGLFQPSEHHHPLVTWPPAVVPQPISRTGGAGSARRSSAKARAPRAGTLAVWISWNATAGVLAA